MDAFERRLALEPTPPATTCCWWYCASPPMRSRIAHRGSSACAKFPNCRRFMVIAEDGDELTAVQSMRLGAVDYLPASPHHARTAARRHQPVPGTPGRATTPQPHRRRRRCQPRQSCRGNSFPATRCSTRWVNHRAPPCTWPPAKPSIAMSRSRSATFPRPTRPSSRANTRPSAQCAIRRWWTSTTTACSTVANTSPWNIFPAATSRRAS